MNCAAKLGELNRGRVRVQPGLVADTSQQSLSLTCFSNRHGNSNRRRVPRRFCPGVVWYRHADVNGLSPIQVPIDNSAVKDLID